MSKNIAVAQVVRQLIAPIFEAYSVEQLNKIPKGFSNNLIWNIAHIIVTEQILVYKLSGLQPMVSVELIEKYKKGTCPQGEVSVEEIQQIKELLNSTLIQTQKDYQAGVFKDFQEYPTSSGYILRNVEDALAYNLFHEGIHLGVIMSLKKLV
jgi:hypothetical protein